MLNQAGHMTKKLGFNMVNTKSKYSSRPKKYTFMNQGTGYAFDPNKTTSFGGKLTTMLDLHIEEVRFRKRKDVFILTDAGKVLDIA
jgi:hypothetical protein